MLLCECGLDPGLDHMLAMEVIDKVIADGGQVGLCFVSLLLPVKLDHLLLFCCYFCA